MNKFATLALAAGLGLAVSAHAQDASGVYSVDPNHTEIIFGVSHLGFSTYYGIFPGATGSLTLDAAKPAASKLEVSVPVAQVMTPSDKLNGELRSAQWLDAAKYPTMTFRSTSITSTGPDTADVAGDLTLHGVTKPVVLKAKLNKAAPNAMMKNFSAGFQVSGQIKRSDFGVSAYVPMVGDNVDLTITAAFARKP
jgi:polyisoprenoid-binding protein YceI